ncbi:ABC transporter substrate-binding protein [Paraglaciecola psychrophila]|nr:extracellular solute-binding protein [Paraglaciecola psychrophila]
MRILIVTIIGLLIFPVLAKQQLKIAASISNSAQRAAYYNLIRAFEDEYPDTQISITSFTSEVFKTKFPQMLLSDQYDILNWHAGERLFEYIEQGNVASISDIFTAKEMTGMFEKVVIDAISLEEKIYALLIFYYQIGSYCHKPLFLKFGLTEPSNWDEFIEVCDILKQNNVSPIYIGNKSNWPATAWLDYLNLRLNGIQFHKDLMRGEASYLDERIQNVLKKLQYISEANYFIQNHQDLEWKQGLPLLSSGLIGMSMLGNYAVQNFPEKIIDKIGYFKFPIFNNQLTYYEEAPLDVLVVPTTSEHMALTKLFIQFAAQSVNQENFNISLGMLSPHKNAQQKNSSLVQEAYITLTNAEGITQFFDRDSKKAYADKATPIIDEFLLNLDIEGTQKALEKVRLTIFTTQAIHKN